MTVAEKRVIFAATPWPSNAELMLDCRELGWLQEDWRIVDATYGRGVWWKLWQPAGLVALHRYQHKKGHTVCVTCRQPLDGHPTHDFRNLPQFETYSFDAAAYDPPYQPRGGATESDEMDDYNLRYGREENLKPPELAQLMADGLTEMTRIVKPGGIILVKCASGVWFSELWDGDYQLADHARHSLGLTLEDELIHITNPRPQSEQRDAEGNLRAQAHARGNFSKLLVYRTPRLNRRRRQAEALF